MTPEWMAEAKCAAEASAADSDGEAQRIADRWFPAEGEFGGAMTAQRRRELDIYAAGVCAGCPVITECLTFALSDLSLSGVWGGTHRAQRLARVRGRRVA